jgi:3-oxoacyl-[acyl-carrier-protein] synthase II
MKPCYINGVGIISPQPTSEPEDFLSHPQEYRGTTLNCVTPDFKQYISPVQLRRLSRLLRIGLSAAIICTREAKDETPGGIVTATGYGLLDDTASFLTEMLEREEQQLLPTHFMQSTYNSLGGLVAVHLHCTGYNNTYVSKGFAFETALLDAAMQLEENPSPSFLVGSYDEAGATQLAVNREAGHYKTESISNLELFETKTAGALQGEGAAFFSLSSAVTPQTWCRVQDIRMLYKPEEAELGAAWNDFLAAHALTYDDIDVVIEGASGDVRDDALLNRLCEDFFHETPQLRFKHLCGEYCTASAFALWMAAAVVKKQTVPEAARKNTIPVAGPIKNVLIANQYRNRHYTLMLLQSL